MELEKRVKIIAKVEMNEQEKMSLALRKHFRIENKEWKKKEVLIDAEDILYNEKKEKEEEERDKIIRKVIPIVDRANKNRRYNLTKKERKKGNMGDK